MEELLSKEEFPKCAGNAPICVQVEPGKIYAWCTCGLSEKQPFCDGQHKKIEGAAFKSLKVEFTEEKEVWLCTCKKTSNSPYCDGSHKQIAG